MRYPVLVAVALVLAATACTGTDPGTASGSASSSTPSSESASSAPSSGATEDGGLDGATTVSVKSARPLHAKVLKRMPAVSEGISSMPLAFSSSGDVLVSNSRFSGGETLTKHTLELRDADGGDTVRFEAPAHDGPPRQVTGADLSLRFVVWMETKSTEINVAPWVLLGYDRRTGTSRVLTRAPRLFGHAPPAVPGYTGPVLSGSRVFWAQVAGRKGKERVSVYGCRVADCTPKRYARGSAYPAATEKALYVLSTQRYTGAHKSTSMRVRRIDLATGRATTLRTIPLVHGQAPAGLAASGHTLAWIVADRRHDRITISDGPGHLTTVTAGEEGGFGYPVATNRFVAWAESSGTSPAEVGGYLYDLKSSRLSPLGNTSGLYNILGAGEYVSWQNSKTVRARARDITNVVGKLR